MEIYGNFKNFRHKSTKRKHSTVIRMFQEQMEVLTTHEKSSRCSKIDIMT